MFHFDVLPPWGFVDAEEIAFLRIRKFLEK
jgi:hypothetical protein